MFNLSISLNISLLSELSHQYQELCPHIKNPESISKKSLSSISIISLSDFSSVAVFKSPIHIKKVF
jgi:hypothetical protein